MNLESFCHDSWVIKKGRLRESRHCCELDLYIAIEQYQACMISKENRETLQKCAICGVSAVQKVWKQLKGFVFSSSIMSYPDKMDDFLEEGFQKIIIEVLECVKKFDPAKLNRMENSDVMRLLSKYVAGTLHFRNICGEIIGIDAVSADESTPTNTLIELKLYLEKVWKDVRENGPKIDAFINESRTRQLPMSCKGRTQKKRLIKYIEARWGSSDFKPKMIVDAIQNAPEILPDKDCIYKKSGGC